MASWAGFGANRSRTGSNRATSRAGRPCSGKASASSSVVILGPLRCRAFEPLQVRMAEASLGMSSLTRPRRAGRVAVPSPEGFCHRKMPVEPEKSRKSDVPPLLAWRAAPHPLRHGGAGGPRQSLKKVRANPSRPAGSSTCGCAAVSGRGRARATGWRTGTEREKVPSEPEKPLNINDLVPGQSSLPRPAPGAGS
jgi:hypothetical protein